VPKLGFPFDINICLYLYCLLARGLLWSAEGKCGVLENE
jgi:hypothetical protein